MTVERDRVGERNPKLTIARWAAALALGLLALPAFAQTRAPWAERFYNPQPSPDDLILPMPCGGSMAFRRIDVPHERMLSDRKIVIGGSDERSIEAQRRVYAPFASTPTMATNNKTAEMIKYVSNSVLATMISFSNEMGNLCSALGDVDVADVMTGVHLARYFTSTLEDGRRVKAGISSFLWAGCGYGGSCLPKDTKALSAHGAAHGAPMPLLDAVIGTNLAQPQRMLSKLKAQFPQTQGLKVAVLGLAFKEDTDDMRESPAIPIVKMLVEAGADVVAYDPIAMPAAKPLLPGAVRYAPTLEGVLEGVDAAMLITRWAEFQRVPELLAGRAKQPLVIDGRRVLKPAALARYDGIGR